MIKDDFFPQKFPFPTTTNNDYLRQTAEDILQLLQATKPPNDTNPLFFGAPVLNKFGEVTKLLGCAVANPATLIPPDQVFTPLPVPVPRTTQFHAAPPRVPFPYSIPLQQMFSPIPVYVMMMSQPPAPPQRVPLPYHNSFHPSPSSTAHYIPLIYSPISQLAHPTFGTHNPFHYINSTQ